MRRQKHTERQQRGGMRGEQQDAWVSLPPVLTLLRASSAMTSSETGLMLHRLLRAWCLKLTLMLMDESHNFKKSFNL